MPDEPTSETTFVQRDLLALIVEKRARNDDWWYAARDEDSWVSAVRLAQATSDTASEVDGELAALRALDWRPLHTSDEDVARTAALVTLQAHDGPDADWQLMWAMVQTTTLREIALADDYAHAPLVAWYALEVPEHVQRERRGRGARHVVVSLDTRRRQALAHIAHTALSESNPAATLSTQLDDLFDQLNDVTALADDVLDLVRDYVICLLATRDERRIAAYLKRLAQLIAVDAPHIESSAWREHMTTDEGPLVFLSHEYHIPDEPPAQRDSGEEPTR